MKKPLEVVYLKKERQDLRVFFTPTLALKPLLSSLTLVTYPKTPNVPSSKAMPPSPAWFLLNLQDEKICKLATSSKLLLVSDKPENVRHILCSAFCTHTNIAHLKPQGG
jgi:hypothetical protein